MNSATVYISPAEASASQVEVALAKIGTPDGVSSVEVVEQRHHPEDWGGYNIVVYLGGYAAKVSVADLAAKLSAELGVPVLTEQELDQRLMAG